MSQMKSDDLYRIKHTTSKNTNIIANVKLYPMKNLPPGSAEILYPMTMLLLASREHFLSPLKNEKIKGQQQGIKA